MIRTVAAAAAFLAGFVGFLGALTIGCGEDAAIIESPETAAGTSRKDAKTSGSSSEDDDADTEEPDSSSKPDSGTKKDAGGSCVGSYEPPALNGPGPCGTDGFGEPAALFGPVDVDAGTTYSGTELADGIYDAINAERASASLGSWRETFVVKGNRFTRIRQIDTGGGGGPGPVTYRSGTFVYETNGADQMIKLTYDCAQSGDTVVDAGVDNLASDAVVASDCSARYRYGVSGIRVTLRRR